MLETLIAALCLAAAPADNWPAFRGTGDSVSSAESLPVNWSESDGIAWRAEITGYGQSSPVIWRNRVFVTSADGARKEHAVMACFDLENGEAVWEQSLEAAQTTEVTDYISRAAPTPAVDDKAVYAFYDTGNLAAWSHDGELLWSRNLVEEYGPLTGNHGVGGSIAITDRAVIVLVDHSGPSYLLAADKKTGKTIWKTDRPANVAWSSPIATNDGRIIVSAAGRCEAFDAETGEQQWKVAGIEGNTVPSATVSGDLVVVGSKDVGSNLAIRVPADRAVRETEIAWRSSDATATFSSPLVYRGHVYLINRTGVAFCLDEVTGETVWKQRIAGSCWASPLGACGRVYFFEKSGTTTVVKADGTADVLAENVLPTEDRVYGVAAVEGRFVIRLGSELVCIDGTD
ncbi:outer membrane biogenesis protein BamB [Maioricimonas rarisocia]|uniref:Outer membrane biogenesis protein BamB n=1 Tax=Maioricimonas rarisocia TaxID=2528026 RepID=A0A517Z6F3_9PLAN|nr:PQQ-binding-like beta-propeller repeat protein [Maioricimonas rarisocia]QDU38054.1 outer membrane biogenesis protein BamB [Maioricimonas rarisocia]